MKDNRISPRIVCAAMLMNDGQVILGIRHYSPEMRVTLRRIYGRGLRLFGRWVIKPYHLKVKEEGFIDQFGKFYNREDALTIALENNQIIRDKDKLDSGELFSENLY